jgi:MoaA/NifB/PqqE/SkfB family radical SAM enzyme
MIVKLNYEDGWHGLESTDEYSFRWMSKRAICRATGLESAPGTKLLKFRAGHSFPDRISPKLEILCNGRSLGKQAVQSVWTDYYFEFEQSGEIEFTFKLDTVFNIPEDTRALGIMISDLEIITAEKEDIRFGQGWLEWEYDEFFPFRWMTRTARLFLPSEVLEPNGYLSFYAFSEFADFSQNLRLEVGGFEVAKVPLLRKWNYYSISFKKLLVSLAEEGFLSLDMSLNKVFPPKHHPSDQRQLGVRLGKFEIHADEENHRHANAFHSNAQLNFSEMTTGVSKLESFPLNLGIDLYGKCNISPPCSYCLWHSMKELEGEYVGADVDEKTLESYGPFFHSARTLVNCSFGEPLLHPRFTQILEFCDKHKKILEISSNGQAFTDRTISALAGKPIFLYVSLDAATAEIYSKIRNDNWEGIVPNLVRLNEERKKKGNLPKIFMVFMPMKVNRGDLEGYFQLCKKIEADALVLRPLLYLWEPKIRVERGGYVFNYKDELLPKEELEGIIKESEMLSEKYNVPLANQFNFGLMESQQEPERKGAFLEFQRS